MAGSPGRIGWPSWDLVGAAAVVLAFDAVVLLDAGGAAVRLLLGLPILVLVPGYAVVAALYPSAEPRGDATAPRGGDSGPGAPPGTPLTTVERLALSVATTIAVVAAIGLVASASPWGIRPVPLIAGITAVTLVGAVVGAFRRARSPSPARPAGLRETLPPLGVLRPRASPTYVLNVLLVLSVIAAAGAVGYAADGGTSGEGFTEFAVLSENENGTLVADEHPTEFALDEGRPLHVRIGNHEGEPIEYTVIVLLEEVESGDGSSDDVASEELDRLEVAVDDGATRTVEYEVRPTTSGDRLRLSFLLYADAPPASPDRDSADRALHIWISVADE